MMQNESVEFAEWLHNEYNAGGYDGAQPLCRIDGCTALRGHEIGVYVVLPLPDDEEGWKTMKDTASIIYLR